MRSANPLRAAPALLVVSALARPSYAQHETQPPPEPQPPVLAPQAEPVAPAPASESAPLWFSFAAVETYTFRADLQEGGNVAIARTGLTLDVSGRAAERLVLALSTELEGSFYSFHDAQSLIPNSAAPFSDVYSVLWTPSASYRIDDTWGVRVGALLRFAGQPDADVGKSFTGGGFAAASYTVSPDLAFSFGVAGYTRLEQDGIIIPVIGLHWRASDKVDVDVNDTTATITAKLNEGWSLALVGGWEQRDFRLSDSGPLPDGAVKDLLVNVGVRLAWRPSSAIELALEGGGVVYQNYQARDSSGHKVGDVDTDPAPYIALRATISF